MSATEKIREYIKKIPAGKSFSANIFRHLASADNVRQILNRLVKSGEITRVARGVFVKPQKIPKVGETLPSAREIAATITKSTGETIVIHGAEAARQLQLTTQVPMQLVFYTNGNTRKLKIGNRTVFLKHVNPSKLIAAGTTTGIVISALSYLGKDNVTTQTIKMIRKNLEPDEFDSLLKHIKNMPAWMANVFYHYNKEQKNE